ncbi:RING finger protein [Anatilimnocola floriformis]|uniref:RING finger protein n=1 Tax=Anatilimnocola floriformis TaxID=2948575 RepID=UPI0020C592EE|nr:RING finger protein [Anatilimnocola floriformis]
MESGVEFAVVLFAIGVIMVIIAGIAYSSHNSDLNRFASIWRGRIKRGGAWDFPQVTFQLGDTPTTLSYSNDGDDVYTHLTMSLFDIRLRMELRPQGIAQNIGKYFGMQDIEIGVPEFDAAFIIQGSNEREIREFLRQDVRYAIMALVCCGTQPHHDLHLQLGGGTLRVTKHEHFTSELQLSEFARCCFKLIRLIQKPLSDGIEFVEGQVRPTISLHDTECQVCGDPLTENVVQCQKCKTPHHLDCWQYFGSCSVYGCGHKRCIVLRK